MENVKPQGGTCVGEAVARSRAVFSGSHFPHPADKKFATRNLGVLARRFRLKVAKGGTTRSAQLLVHAVLGLGAITGLIAGLVTGLIAGLITGLVPCLVATLGSRSLASSLFPCLGLGFGLGLRLFARLGLCLGSALGSATVAATTHAAASAASAAATAATASPTTTAASSTGSQCGTDQQRAQDQGQRSAQVWLIHVHSLLFNTGLMKAGLSAKGRPARESFQLPSFRLYMP